ncbi:MAG: hypothetical protein U5L08_09575 [Xanthomonadales bacterium]|nr:hypothetical protein [Xanthomonadales bacterium]
MVVELDAAGAFAAQPAVADEARPLRFVQGRLEFTDDIELAVETDTDAIAIADEVIGRRTGL